MIGAVLDWVVLHTIKDGYTMPSGEQIITDFPISHWVRYNYDPLKTQPTYPEILDVGSMNVNGSFQNYNFFSRGDRWSDIVKGDITGIDLAEGAGVTEVMSANEMSFSDESFDLILCLEMLEHDEKPAQSIKEIYRVLKPGQPLILTCPNEQAPEHHQGVSDHYNFISKDKLIKWLKSAGFKKIEYATNNEGAAHHLIYAIKPKEKK